MSGPRDIESLASQAGTTADVAIQATTDKQPRVALGQFNLAQVAAVYPLLTATGDVLVEVISAYVYTAATGLTSVTLTTSHTTPKSVVASTNLASLTLDAILSIVTPTFVLPNGKKLQGTIVGTGTAGLIYLSVRWTPLTAGATLA